MSLLRNQYINIYWIISFILLSFFSIIQGSTSIIIFYTFCTSCLLLFANDSKEVNLGSIILLSGIVVGVGLFCYYIGEFGTPYYNELPSDDHSYERYAQSAASEVGWFQFGKIKEQILPPAFNSPGYVYILTIIVRISELFGGFHTFIPKILNITLHSIGAILIYRILRYTYKISEVLSSRIAYLYGLFPYLLFLSAHTFRDIIIGLCFIAVYYIFINYDKLKFTNIVFSIFLIYLAYTLRLYSAVFMIGIIFACIQRSSPSKLLKYSISIFAVCILGYALFFIQVSSYGSLLQTLIFEQIRSTQSNIGGGIGGSIFAIPLLPFGWFLRIVYLFISPVPFLTYNFPDLFISIGTSIQIYIYAFVIYGYYKFGLAQKWTNVILWAIILGVSITSFQYRHLTMVLPFLFLVFGIYWHNYKKNKVSLINTGVVITYLLLWPPVFYIMIKYL